MSWYRVDDQATFHPKIVRAGNEAFGAITRFGTYCSAYLTDGFVPEAIALSICSQSVIDSLVSCDLLLIADGGYEIHDYLDYNPSKEEAIAKREARSQAGAIGGTKSGESKRHSKTIANGIAKAEAKGKQNCTPSPSPSPSPYPVPSASEEANKLASPPKTEIAECFQQFRSLYPKRSGSLEWAKGEQKFVALVKAGTDPNTIIEGCRRYRSWCDATSKTGTEMVKQVPTFLNGKCWLESFDLPEISVNGKAGESSRRQMIEEALKDL